MKGLAFAKDPDGFFFSFFFFSFFLSYPFFLFLVPYLLLFLTLSLSRLLGRDCVPR